MKTKPFSPLPLDLWPKQDRAAWLLATQPGDVFSKPGVASKWRPATIRLAEEGYGLYLAWAQANGPLSPDGLPIDRVNEERVSAFIADYAVGRAELTVATTVRGVAYVLRATHPPEGLSWLTKFVHRLMNSAKPAKSKADRMATVAELIDLGVSLMKRGRDDLEKGHCSGAQCFRDGLMIAALAMRPLRRRNFAALQIGKTFLPDCEHYRVSFKGKETKTGRGIEFDYPPSVSAPFAFYLSEARPVLLKRSNTPDDGFLWVGRRGRAMDGEEITQRIGNVTRRQLGRRVSPHLFRDCVATDIAIHDPKHIGIVKSVLGHATLASSQKYYNQATSFEAARRHQSIIAALRGAT